MEEAPLVTADEGEPAPVPFCYQAPTTIQLRTDCDQVVPSVGAATASLNEVHAAVASATDSNNDGRISICLRHDTRFLANAQVAVQRNNVTLTSNARNRRATIDVNNALFTPISIGVFQQPNRANNFSIHNITFEGRTAISAVAAVASTHSDLRDLTDLCFDLGGGRPAIQASTGSIGAMRRVRFRSGVSNQHLAVNLVQLYRAPTALMQGIEILNEGGDFKHIYALQSNIAAISGLRTRGLGTAVALEESSLGMLREASIVNASNGVTSWISKIGSIEDSTISVTTLDGVSIGGAISLSGSYTVRSELQAVRNVQITVQRNARMLNFDVATVGAVTDSSFTAICSPASPCSGSNVLINRSQVALISNTVISNPVVDNSGISIFGTAEFPARLDLLDGASLVTGGVFVGANSTLKQSIQ